MTVASRWVGVLTTPTATVDRRPSASENLPMRFPRADDPELLDVIDRYVIPEEGHNKRYLKLLHGNFLALNEQDRATFLRLLVDAANQITDHELGILLESEWRSRITAAWLIGASRRGQFRERIGALLLESGLVYAGQGYCFALASLGTAADAEILVSYLDRFLRRPDLHYNQDWALGALQHIDAGLATHYAAQFMQPEGLWQQWAASNRADAADQKQRIDTLCFLVKEAVRIFQASRDAASPHHGSTPAFARNADGAAST